MLSTRKKKKSLTGLIKTFCSDFFFLIEMKGYLFKLANQDILLGYGPPPHPSTPLKIIFFLYLFQIKLNKYQQVLWTEQKYFNQKIGLQAISKEFCKINTKKNVTFRSLTFGKQRGFVCSSPGLRLYQSFSRTPKFMQCVSTNAVT